ncbi:MAG: type IV pilin N-terminal domain-containing protein [Candidatus Methanoperedenaceae archaeon]|nr:type IV pilin N-terminal domain-containing protein [Candidatus Methanoperedenaceae archaeon]
MKNFMESKHAVSSVMGVILMAGLTVVLIGTIAMSVLAYTVPSDAPDAKIVIRQARGDIGTLYKNYIILSHKGGDSLLETEIKVIITGKGRAYAEGSMPSGLAQDIRVTYMDLTGSNYGKESGINLGEIVDGKRWIAGNTITLYGKDGTYMGTASPQNNTVDKKWTLEEGSVVVVTVVDSSTNSVIASSSIKVKPY